MILSTRAAMADIFQLRSRTKWSSARTDDITFALARAIGRELKPGDENRRHTLDHDANVAPWARR